MVLIIIIFVIIIVIASAPKQKNLKASSTFQTPSRSNETTQSNHQFKQVVIHATSAHLIAAINNDKEDQFVDWIETKFSAPNKYLDEYVFTDHFGENFICFDYLTPEQAEDILQQRKATGKYIPTEEYFGYINAINNRYNSDYLKFIANSTAKEIEQWYKFRKDLSTTVWKSIAEKLAPLHEEYLLSKMQKGIYKKTIVGWVRTRKHEGYFFSKAAYERALDIYNKQPAKKTSFNSEDDKKQIENIKRNIRRNRVKMNEFPGESKYQKLYDEYSEAYEFLTGEKYSNSN